MSEKEKGAATPAAATPTAADSQDANAPARATRRGFLTGIAALGASAAAMGALAGCSSDDDDDGNDNTPPPAPAPVDVTAQLRKNVKTLVVIFAENRSFNNLFANFPGVEKPLSALTAADYTQNDRDGTPLPVLPPVWGGMVPTSQQANHVAYQVAENAPYMNNLPNAPFDLRGPQGEPLPQGVVTRDLWHVFYQNQMQINGGKNDRFVAWADSGALVMGHYGDSAYNLRLWKLAQEFVLCDNFFQGAFGGSFLNHQYLIAGRPPFYPNAAASVASTQIAQLQSSDPADPRLQPKPASPASALTGIPQFGASALTPDGYGVNTMAPPYWPSFSRDAAHPELADATSPQTMVPQEHPNIGDLMDAKGLDWAWYAGGWQAAVDSTANSGFPSSPNFQAHHQPFNYFKSTGPGTAARAAHLRDGGLGDLASTNRFLADAEAGKLPPLTFYKPQGNLNMHAGYADVDSGDRHIAHIVDSLRKSAQWENMVVVITVDENGGWWDHVAPPAGDRWGPGTRVPALVVSPFARKGTVDHTIYDTGSILRLAARLFDLPTLDGLKARDDAMKARGQQPMGDLTNALAFNA
ncbi:acid phosphatase [Achromobacter xylosoxidans]|uniref:acid phosphatase n=1 Tax=Alcaligenes xylosoxydans xylosoxydans TaxID=85698 RepID=UPI0005F8ED64|nr:acid phosphatase [Achromobacter xylosoxidans]MCH1996418.1 acid phosphatase [Achromobacter xylosoxidans]CUJ67305.1 Phospholipase C 2 precursor [Achromobacter xylosoxidans]